MKSMFVKFNFTTAIAAAAMFLSAGMSNAEVVKIGTDGGASPWTFTDSAGKLIGFDIDVGDEICARMKTECEWVINDWNGIFPAMQLGKFQMIMAGLNATDERRKTMDFSRNFAVSLVSFAVKEGNDLENYKPSVDVVNFDDLNDAAKAELKNLKAALNGKTVGIQTGTSPTGMMKEIFGETQLREYAKMETRDLDIQAERLGAGIADSSYWKKIAKNEKVSIKMFGPKLGGGPHLGGGVVAAIKKDQGDLKARVDAAIESMIADGTLVKLTTKWLGADASPKK